MHWGLSNLGYISFQPAICLFASKPTGARGLLLCDSRASNIHRPSRPYRIFDFDTAGSARILSYIHEYGMDRRVLRVLRESPQGSLMGFSRPHLGLWVVNNTRSPDVEKVGLNDNHSTYKFP